MQAVVEIRGGVSVISAAKLAAWSPGGVTRMVWRFWPPKTKPRPQGCSFPGTADVPGGSSTGGGAPPDVWEIAWVLHHEQHGNRCPSRRLPGKANFPRTKASFWREIRSSAFASQDRLYSTSLSAPPSRQNQLQVDGGLRWDIEQCPPRLVRAQKRPALRPLPPTLRPSCSCLLPTRPRCLL